MKVLNFINNHKYTYINVCETYFPAFQAFWQHAKALPLQKITVTTVGFQYYLGCLGGPIQKSHTFKLPLSQSEFGFSFQDLILFKLSLRPHFKLFSVKNITSAPKHDFGKNFLRMLRTGNQMYTSDIDLRTTSAKVLECILCCWVMTQSMCQLAMMFLLLAAPDVLKC